VGILKSDWEEGWDIKMFRSSVAAAAAAAAGTSDTDTAATTATAAATADATTATAAATTATAAATTATATTAGGVRFVHPDGLSLCFEGATAAASTTTTSTTTTATAAGDSPATTVTYPTTIPTTIPTTPTTTPTTPPTPTSASVLRDAHGPIAQFAIECSQAELLAMDRDILTKIISYPHLNDIRTIFLAHDKRMLSVLTSPDIMSDYLAASDVRLLMDCIVPTYVCGVHADIVAAAKLHRSDWLIKPNGGGKGIGIVFGRDSVSDESWSEILDNPLNSQFVLQRVVLQQVVGE
jgi:hypothetical protein